MPLLALAARQLPDTSAGQLLRILLAVILLSPLLRFAVYQDAPETLPPRVTFAVPVVLMVLSPLARGTSCWMR